MNIFKLLELLELQIRVWITLIGLAAAVISYNAVRGKYKMGS